MIYMNHAATCFPIPEEVIQAIAQAMRTFGNAGRGVNETSLSASRCLASLREELANLMGLSYPERVVFTDNATYALNMAIMGLCDLDRRGLDYAKLKPGDHIITADTSHNAVLRPLYRLLRHGFVIDYLPADKNGDINLEELETMIVPETKMVVLSHASNLTGKVIDVSKIGDLCQKHGLIFILDTAQTAGAYPINMEKDHIDIVCFTGHKALLGPQGTGGLLVSPEIKLNPLIIGGTGVHSFDLTMPEDWPEHMEAGTLNAQGLAGLLAGVRLIRRIGIREIMDRESALRIYFEKGLREIPGVHLYGRDREDGAAYLPITLLNLKGIQAGELADVLSTDYGIQVRAGGHCAPRMHQALGTDRISAVRFSFAYSTTKEEIDQALNALGEISAELREEGSC